MTSEVNPLLLASSRALAGNDELKRACAAALRLDELYRTVERSQGDERTSAMVEVCAIRKKIKQALAPAGVGDN